MKINEMETITFKSDGFTLTGTLHLPEVSPAPMVIGCHGLMADRNSPKQVELAEACCRKGIGYFRFDHRGCGDSEGEFYQVTSPAGRQQDLLDAIRLVRSQETCNGNIGLFGSSMGGTVCISVSPLEKIDTLVTLAAPLHSHFKQAENNPLHTPFDITPEACQVGNILIFHGECDEVVPLSHARSLYDRARHPKKLTIQPGGDHRMSNPEHQSIFIRESVAWFKKYLYL